jgi:hypothetical protein
LEFISDAGDERLDSRGIILTEDANGCGRRDHAGWCVTHSCRRNAQLRLAVQRDALDRARGPDYFLELAC